MFVGNYVGEKWGLPDYCWEYGTKPNFNFHNSDFGFDVFTDKINDSRFQKSFRLEYVTGLNTSGSSTPGANGEYYTYNDEKIRLINGLKNKQITSIVIFFLLIIVNHGKTVRLL